MQDKQVLFIAPIFHYYPIIASSLMMQRHQNWKLFLVHDGPCDKNIIDLPAIVENFHDHRIIYHETPERQQQFGHPIRKWILEEMKQGRMFPDTHYVNITNADNYHCPSYCDMMLSGFRSSRTVATYCSWIIHNYIAWNPMESILRLASIDTCAVLVRRDAACEIGWQSMDHSSDWVYISSLMERYGAHHFNKIPGALVVHN